VTDEADDDDDAAQKRRTPGFAIVDLGPRVPRIVSPRRYIMRQWPDLLEAQKELVALLHPFKDGCRWRQRLTVGYFDGHRLIGDWPVVVRRGRRARPAA
jgi:hypothetical protein